MAVVIGGPIAGPAAWRGEDLARSADWIRPIAPAHVDELTRRAGACRRAGLAWRDITREDFQLPGLSRALADVSEELERGRGVVLLRGLPVARWSEDDLNGSTGASAATWARRATRTPTAS